MRVEVASISNEISKQMNEYIECVLTKLLDQYF